MDRLINFNCSRRMKISHGPANPRSVAPKLDDVAWRERERERETETETETEIETETETE